MITARDMGDVAAVGVEREHCCRTWRWGPGVDSDKCGVRMGLASCPGLGVSGVRGVGDAPSIAVAAAGTVAGRSRSCCAHEGDEEEAAAAAAAAADVGVCRAWCGRCDWRRSRASSALSLLTVASRRAFSSISNHRVCAHATPCHATPRTVSEGDAERKNAERRNKRLEEAFV